MRSTFLTLFLAIAGCDVTIDDKNKLADDAHNAHLNQAKQDECSAQGKFYDRIAQVDQCSQTHDLAKWPCTREGLKTRLGGDASSQKDLVSLDQSLAEGYTMHLCGESKSDIIVMLVQQKVVDKTASTQIIKKMFLLPKLRFRYENTPAQSELRSSIGECTAVKLVIYDQTGRSDLASRDILARVSVTLDPSACKGSATAKARLFSDAGCEKETTTANIAVGQQQTILYVKGDDQACFRLRAVADDVDESTPFHFSVKAP